MIGYKVVTPELQSVVEDRATVQYIIGKKVKRPNGCGPLAVFFSLPAAQSFAFIYRESRLFRCEYAESIDCTLWNGRECADWCSSATRYADWVKLLEEIT